jgi:hypothetical protein
MNFEYKADKGIITVAKSEREINNITLFLTDSECKVKFDDNSMKNHEDTDDNVVIEFCTDDNHEIKLNNVNVYGQIGKFTEFTVKKGDHGNRDYKKRFYISDHDFEGNFDITLDGQQISFVSAEGDSYFEFHKNSKEYEKICCDIFKKIQHLCSIYYGRCFRFKYVLTEDENFTEIGGYPDCGYMSKRLQEYQFTPIPFNKFVETVFNEFCKNEKIWNLNLLFAYFIQYFSSNILETQFLNLSIFFENLKYSYAENVADIQKGRPGEYIKPKKNLFCRLFQKGKGKYSFIELLELTYKELKINNGYTGFYGYRNKVVHTGKIPDTDNSAKLNSALSALYMSLDQSKEIIAILLNFHGYIYFTQFNKYMTLDEYQKIKQKI